jgi:hypothetical protein
MLSYGLLWTLHSDLIIFQARNLIIRNFSMLQPPTIPLTHLGTCRQQRLHSSHTSHTVSGKLKQEMALHSQSIPNSPAQYALSVLPIPPMDWLIGFLKWTGVFLILVVSIDVKCVSVDECVVIYRSYVWLRGRIEQYIQFIHLNTLRQIYTKRKSDKYNLYSVTVSVLYPHVWGAGSCPS